MRFANKEALREHLDWLFRQNRRKRGTREQVVVGGQSRGWFDAMDVFLGTVDPNAKPTNPSVNKKNVEDDSDDRTVSVVEAKSDNDICAACHEAFETFWDDDKHAWMLRDCTKTDDGELYHVKCMQYAVLNADDADDTPVQQQEDDDTKPDLQSASPATTNIFTNSQGFSSTTTKPDPMPKPASSAVEAVSSANDIKEELAQLQVEETGARGSTGPFASQVNASNNQSARGSASLEAGVLKKEHVLPKQEGSLAGSHSNKGGVQDISVHAMNKKQAQVYLTDGHPKQEAAKEEPLELKGGENAQLGSVSSPSGRKRKRTDNEAEGTGSHSMMETPVDVSAELKGDKCPEPPSKRQKEGVSQVST